LIVAGLLTKACVSFPVLSALKVGFEVFVVADECAGLTPASHELALRRLEQAGARLTNWIQVLLEFQRDWTRHETYEAARAIVVAAAVMEWDSPMRERSFIRPESADSTLRN
jgi:nicotinamidase-related amidase